MKMQASNWLTGATLLVVRSASIAQSTSYPQTKGSVSDYAAKLSQAQVTELASFIQVYERQTSIEIAVVVVNGLQGQTAKEYATGIGDSWGVGKADRNNGIVLLWAPNERAYSLRIADGLSQDLTDVDAAKITHDFLLPNFRREEYYAGLKETVQRLCAALETRAGKKDSSYESKRHIPPGHGSSLPCFWQWVFLQS